ncbi:unnamed protein product [Paramecium sonneborni]|uniref:Uncharacterized protein n=1 Tax=Paramecium sonneborni TaxID=65129 RepID=A0A8S1MMK6_9CILI|nr:unnamed protein product [Paramecium sonneborni]
MKIGDSKLASAIKNVIIANKNVEIIKDVLQEDPREMNVSVFDQVGQENQDVKYLDLFIHLTEQCLNNPNKSATLCTDLILKISYVISDPSKWSKHFNNTIQFQKNQIHEKINQFLSNCTLLVENQKPVQKIIIMALTNLVTINEPEDETLCESCLKTLKILYKNNPDLKQLLKKTIQKNILTNLEQKSFLTIPICLLKGLTDFASEIKLGDWMTDQQCILFGRWLEQIFAIFKDDKSKIDQSVECTLQLMSKCFVAESFATQLEEFITMDGVMDILSFCFDQGKKAKPDENVGKKTKPDETTAKKEKPEENKAKKAKPDEIFTKNKIIVFVFEMISSLNRFLKKSNPNLKEQYSEKISKEISKMIDELESDRYHFANSEAVKTQEQCQIMNKKLGSLIRAYGKILVDNPSYTKIQSDQELNDQNKKKEKELLASQNEKPKAEKKEEKIIFFQVLKLLTIKKLDPYIYGSLCQFLVTILESQVCTLYLGSIIANTENFNTTLLLLQKNLYSDFILMARVYGNIQISAEHSLANMPTLELQYAVLQILKVFECIQKKASDPNDCQKFQDKLKSLEQWNYKSIILSCLEAPVEEIRIVTTYLLSNIPSRKWEFEDLKNMQKILEKLQQLLSDGQGEEEISCLLMIFCNIVSSNTNPVSYQFRQNTSSQNLCVVSYKILRTNMSRDTRGDENQTRQKIALSASCVYLLSQYLYSQQLRNNFFNQKALFEIGEALRLEDQLGTDVKTPLSIESICLVVQPLFQSIESDFGINITHLNFFRVLMQISSILNFQKYSSIQSLTKTRAEIEKEIQAQKDLMQSKKHKGPRVTIAEEYDYDNSQSADDILSHYKRNLHQQCQEQWDNWKIQKFPNYKNLDYIDDLISAFEVQHTIFSSQNGVDRLLACLQPLIQNVHLDLEEKTISLDSIYQQEGNEYQSKVVTSSLSKHAIVSKLVGYPQNQDLNISRFSSQFFEVVQQKKILANSMVDLKSFGEEQQQQFYEYMSLSRSHKTKIALITSAFLYSCYISIIFAPEASILCNALTEIQQKEKLIGYIKLCAASDWYNSCVSIKLFKIYRLIGRHMIFFFNSDNSFNFLKFVQEEIIKQLRQSNELPAVLEPKLTVIKKQIKEIDVKQKQLKKKPLFSAPKPEEYMETCYLINKTIQIIVSDFKEIIQSLNKKQLLEQLKLINSIFKTLQIVFKQMLMCVVEIRLDEYTQIFSAIRKIYKQIGAQNFFDELTQCMQKLDKKLQSMQSLFQSEDSLQKQQYYLFVNLAQILGILFIQKGQSLKQLFGNLCQRFDSAKLSETVNNGIKAWVAQMVMLHLFTYRDIYNPFVNQIPIHETIIDFKKLEGYTRFKNCLLLVYNTYFIVLEIVGVQVNQDFLQTQVTQKNYKIHLHVQGQQIRESTCSMQQQAANTNMTEEQRQEFQEHQDEINEGLKVMDLQIMNLEGNSKKADQDYLFYFQTKWDCAKYIKLFNLLQNADTNFENPLI